MAEETTEPEFNWCEITKEFQEASEELELGELIHDTNFGLFEAMSAIEMMDPKMDAGMMCNKAKRNVYNLEQAIQAGTVKVDDISQEELIAIMDDTLACFVTWLEGHSLAQTVFTNLYLHNPYIIEDRPLKAFSILMLKMADLLRDKINRAGVFEEEDFQAMTYGFKMAADVSDLRATGMIKEVEEEINRHIKTTRSRVGEERDSDTEHEHELAVAVHTRLKFCRLFFSAMLAFNKEKCAGIADADKYIGQMQELLPLMTSSISLGVTAPHIEQSPADYPAVMGFEPLINQRLLPPTFPRYTQIKSRVDTVDYLSTMCARLKTVCQLPTAVTGLHNMLEFFHEFSKTSPCVLSRSLLQLVFIAPNNRRLFGQTVMTDILRDTVRNFISPPYLMPRSPLASLPQAKEYVEAFLSHAVRPMTALFQVTGHNRARQRDKWAHLLDDLAALQDEGDKVDAFLHNQLIKMDSARQHLACFGTWVLYHTLQVMIHYMLAGFELELYAVHEYHYIFWYLYECLYSWLISTLGRADNFYLDQQEYLEHQKQTTGGGKKKKDRKKKRQPPHSKEVALAQAAQSLCGGYYKAVVGLQLVGKLKQPKFDFDCEEVRYNHRFAPFGCLVTPPVVQYKQYKDLTDISRYEPIQATDFYGGSCKCFQQARVYYESIPNPSAEVQTLLKVAKTNFVVMKLLMGGHKRDDKDPPEFDFSLHKKFPVIKL